MADWRNRLRGDPIPWLLEADDAALRYRVLTGPLGRPADDPAVRAAYAEIPGSPTIARILALQRPDGAWGDGESASAPAYGATVWQLMLLAELGMPGQHPAVRRGLALAAEEFAQVGLPQTLAEGRLAWCYSGLILRCLAALGLAGTDAAQQAALRLIELGARDPAFTCGGCEGRTCLWGVVKALRGFAALPAHLRPAGTERLMEAAARRLLAYDYAAGSAQAGLTEDGWESDWRKFGFPSFWQSDLLEALSALAEAGFRRDPAYARLTALVLDKQDEQGRWTLENSLNSRLPVPIEEKGRPSRWVTLRALEVLREG